MCFYTYKYNSTYRECERFLHVHEMQIQLHIEGYLNNQLFVKHKIANHLIYIC